MIDKKIFRKIFLTLLGIEILFCFIFLILLRMESFDFESLGLNLLILNILIRTLFFTSIFGFAISATGYFATRRNGNRETQKEIKKMILYSVIGFVLCCLIIFIEIYLSYSTTAHL